MLEERLSKTYSQHNIGGYDLPAPRQASAAYPSMAPNTPGVAENFYTGEQPVDYGRAPAAHTYPQHPNHVPQPAYAGYDKRASISVQPGQYPQPNVQRSESWQSQPPSAPAPYAGPGYGAGDQASQAHIPQAPPQPHAAPGPVSADPAANPAADPNAAFYYNNPQQDHSRQTPSVAGEQLSSPYPNLQQPLNYNIQSVPPTPASVPAQPNQPPQQPQPQPQQHLPSMPQQQAYWQQPQHTGQAPQVYQAQNPGYSGYTQESFPSAPQHTPQQPVVEESLIDL